MKAALRLLPANHVRLAGVVLAGPVVDERAPMPWQQGMRLSRDMLRESPTANWIVAIANIAAVTLMYVARVADEEKMMIDQFGDEYRAYMRNTGRLLPKL